MRGHFNIIHHATGYKADIYVAGRDALHVWGLANVRRVEIDGRVVHVAPPEYVILRKLEFFREGQSEKHIRDIRAIVDNMSSDLDRALIERNAHERGLTEIWNSVIS